MRTKKIISILPALALLSLAAPVRPQEAPEEVEVPVREGLRTRLRGEPPPRAMEPILIDAPGMKPRVTLPIVEVVVYEDRALVTREHEVKVSGGVKTIIVVGLPPALLETSLRAGLSGMEGRVISVASDIEEKREIQDSKLREVDEKRKAVGREIALLTDDLARIAAREAYLDSYEKLAGKAVSERTAGYAKPEVESWGKALQFVREGRSAALAERREAEKKIEVLKRDQGDLAAEAQRLRRPAERSERTAEVSLESKGAGRAVLRLSYVIEGAGWSPRYDARFDPEKGELAVTYFGEVRQRTGEDWNESRLVLSTARPSVGASRPELFPVQLVSTPLVPGAKGKGIATEKVPAGGMLAIMNRNKPNRENALNINFDLVTAQVHEGATAATFSVPGTATIPADGRPHKVPVATFRERGETSFETVPLLQRFVYLKCAAKNGSPYPMLAGAVDIFRGSGFIGTSSLKFVAPGRPFEVSLGIEESLKVRRAATFDSWTGRGKEKRRGFDIEIANFGEKKEAVMVIENYPVSDIEEVQVDLASSTTHPTERNEKEGILKWRLEVPPGETRLVHIEYTIVYPKDYTGE